MVAKVIADTFVASGGTPNNITLDTAGNVTIGAGITVGTSLNNGTWTTGTRPTPVAGIQGYNSTTGNLEFYNGLTSSWTAAGGSGTVSAGTAGQLATYAASGTTVSGLTLGTSWSTALAANLGTGVSTALGLATNTSGGLATTATAFTAGSVVFSNGTQLQQDNANLFWDNTNNRLGIGTNIPTQSLDVSGQALIGKNGTLGYSGLLQGTAINTGYLAFYDASNTRQGYVGYVGATPNPFLNIETDTASYGIRLAISGTPVAVLQPAGSFVVGSQTFQNGTRLLAYDNASTNSTLGGFYADSNLYASSCQVIWVTRSSDASYSFLVTRNNADTNTAHSLRGDGNAYCDGTWNNNGADYAEFFESVSGDAIPVGTTVVLENNKVRVATASDDGSKIIGVIRPKEPSCASMSIGNTAWNKWANKHLTDDFDRYIMEDHDVIEWKDEDGKYISYESHLIPSSVVVPENAVRKSHDEKGVKLQHYKINPLWNENIDYIPRENRKEWNIVGLLGQVKISKGQPMNDRWIKMRDVSSSVEEWFIR